jgi:hypothetical protein
MGKAVELTYYDNRQVFVAPTGKVIVAINVVIADTSFTTLTPIK